MGCGRGAVDRVQPHGQQQDRINLPRERRPEGTTPTGTFRGTYPNRYSQWDLLQQVQPVGPTPTGIAYLLQAPEGTYSDITSYLLISEYDLYL